jgi:hypothetical protein
VLAKPKDTEPAEPRALESAIRALRRKVKVDHRYDVPFLGGCATDARTVYIDRHLPQLWRSGPHLARVEPFVLLHECIEFALMGTFGLE